MDRDYEPLPIRELGASAGFRRPLPPPATPVTLESPAADVMTPAEQVEVIAFQDVAGARVGHVLETLRRAGRQHALVVDFDPVPARRLLEPPSRRTMVRGIFSLSQIARQLGVAVQTGGEV